jgi:lipopolysaccharide/colanic/teichoic acid biosynthesis glycosyltransferase
MSELRIDVSSVIAEEQRYAGPIVADISLPYGDDEPIPYWGQALKRFVDIVIALPALILLAPVIALIALIIRLESRGPSLYNSERMGKGNRPFTCYKMRTMVLNADELKEHIRHLNYREGATFKIVGDPRVTRFGAFLRKYSLDELPQLLNVLRGEMSIVGPRPHNLDDVTRYRSRDLLRHRVKPGLTGLWQIFARRDPSFSRNMELDNYYIETWSLWLDFQIIGRTFMVVMRGEGQ